MMLKCLNKIKQASFEQIYFDQMIECLFERLIKELELAIKHRSNKCILIEHCNVQRNSFRIKIVRTAFGLILFEQKKIVTKTNSNKNKF
jgi:hypothetical protein